MGKARLRFGILTRNLPPLWCGIADHSISLAEHLKRQGHEVLLIGSRGDAAEGVQIVTDEWGERALVRLRSQLEGMQCDHLMMQYTPLMYASGNRTEHDALVRFWQKLSIFVTTSLIVHETYFRTWRRPLSLVRGTYQRRALRAMCRASHHVFTSSEPLLSEMAGWKLKRAPVMLPISSNIPVLEADTDALRARHDVSANALMLTLFGGGNNLKWMLDQVLGLERRLQADGIACVWLLLGGVPMEWLPATARVLDPGRLPLHELTAYLQMTDVFLMPNWSGVSAKRGTLMAALEHALPVVGTRGYMTDPFWIDVEGVKLIDSGDILGFSRAVVALASDPQLRRRLGDANRDYFLKHFTWVEIISRLLGSLQSFEDMR